MKTQQSQNRALFYFLLMKEIDAERHEPEALDVVDVEEAIRLLELKEAIQHHHE